MVIDIIFLIIAGYGFFIGFTRGIIKTLLYVLSIMFGLIVAVKFAPAATDLLTTVFNYQSSFMYLAGFLLCLALTIIFIRLIARGSEGLLRTANINIINQFLGGVLMGGLTTLLYSGLLWFGAEAHLLNATNTADSMSYPYLKEYPAKAKKVVNYVAPTFKDFWNESIDFIDRMQEASVKRTESDPKIYDLDESKPPQDTTK